MITVFAQIEQLAAMPRVIIRSGYEIRSMTGLVAAELLREIIHTTVHTVSINGDTVTIH